jgi:hypothetical protein
MHHVHKICKINIAASIKTTYLCLCKCAFAFQFQKAEFITLISIIQSKKQLQHEKI